MKGVLLAVHPDTPIAVREFLAHLPAAPTCPTIVADLIRRMTRHPPPHGPNHNTVSYTGSGVATILRVLENAHTNAVG